MNYERCVRIFGNNYPTNHFLGPDSIYWLWVPKFISNYRVTNCYSYFWCSWMPNEESESIQCAWRHISYGHSCKSFDALYSRIKIRTYEQNLTSSKHLIMNIYENSNSAAFYNMSWISFAISMGGMIAGILYLESEIAIKGFLFMGYLFTVTSCFTLSKVIRDKHESERFITKMEKAKTEKFMADNVENIVKK